ncbi:response regulator [Luteolibacter yonseiensis]|uniref:histidine kinase n=1 Tax=Luteolibacter yonseiensis TaxID=1144680 RepID=A0A934VCR7_9BACT|nr:ATP-binding protein [Luteolibacter yonseiensis]MBK1817430.1 response regulator [Luteolibacter yonseiensis]
MSDNTAIVPSASNEQGQPNHHWVSSSELLALKQKLREAQETLEAIQSGDVDAVVVSSEEGSHIYTLNGAEEPYRIFVEQMQEGAVTVSEEGLVLYCNRKFSEFLGLPLEKVISSPLADHFEESVWKSIRHGLSQAGTTAVKVETSLPGSGRPLPVLITASTLMTVGEEITCLVVTDLSDQKRNETLTLARDVAEAANHSKDSFLAVLSHELRTPLTPALMAASLLERDPALTDQSRELAVMIRRNVEVETRLIDDLLDLTRITQGKIQLRKEIIDVHKIIRDAAAVCQAELDDHGQHLSLELVAARSQIVGDPVRIQQVLWNLIRNASKFSGRAKQVFITSENTADGTLRVAVRDEGVGIPEDILPRLFSPFEQGSEEITRRFGGLGLGLVISKSIVELHDGRIEAFSEGQDRGSRFELSFQPLPAKGEKRSPEGSPNKGTILLVEDNSDSRLTMTILLNSLGYAVEGAKDLRTALSSSEDRNFDLVISDIGLPDGTGYEFMREFRTRSKIPSIAVSGYGQNEDIEKALEAGFNYHLVKPVDSRSLEATVLKALLSGS